MKKLLLLLLSSLTLSINAQWQGVGSNNGVIDNSSASAKYSLTLNSSNEIYLAYAYNKANVKKYNGTTWDIVGNPEFSAGEVGTINLKIDGNDVPYVAYKDPENSQKITVKKLDGANWVTVGSEGFSVGIGYSPILAFDSNNTPYVAFGDSDDAGGAKISVMKFDGTSWVYVGVRQFSDKFVYKSLTIDSNDTLYVSFGNLGNASGGKASVMKFNGTSWELVGAAAFSEGYTKYHSLATDSNNVLYVAFNSAGINGGASSVMKYNGTSWEHVGVPGMGIYTTEQQLIIKGTALYLASRKTTGSSDVMVHEYNGTSWIKLGNNFIGSLITFDVSSNHIPYIAYNGTSGLQVQKYIGASLNVIHQTLSYNVSIFPNPAINQIKITLKSNESIKKIEIYTLLGKRVLVKNNNQSETTVNVSSLYTGLYIVKIAGENHTYSQKLIIQ